ncbi:MAG: hypothetical protein RI894_209, partial [Bacteroidota bacterium]
NGLFSPIGASNTVLGTLCNYFTPYQIQSAKIMRMDYNGDGYDDWVVTSEEVRYPLVYDANNVQLPDKHRYTKVKIEIYLSTPAATQPYTATPITINHQYDLNPDNIDQQLQYLVTDLDGDKKQEILITYSTGLTFLYSQTINTVIQLPGSGAVTANGDFMWTLMPLDYNGNGKTDLMFINKQANTSRYNLYELTQPLNNLLTPGASNFKLLTTGNDRFNVGDFLYTGDFNGDGKTDILARPRNDDPADFAQLKTWGVHYNTDKSDGSDGFTWQANVLNDILGTKVPATYTKYQCYESYNPLGVYVADFNADGLSDILMVENHKYTIPTVGGIDVSCKFYMSKGMGLNAPISKRLHLEGNADDARTLFGNFDGNSTLDLLVENGWASAPDSLIRILQKPGTDRLVTHISNNRETDTYITYAQTTDVSGIHTRTGTGTIPAADYPLKARELNAPLNIVSQVKQLNGNTDPAKQFTTTNYTYKGLKAHNDLGILGFEEMTATTDLYNEDGTTTPVKTVNTYEFWLNDQYNTRIYAPEQKSVTTYLGTKKVGEMIRTNGVQTYTNVGDAALGLDKRRYTTFAQTVSSTEYDVMTAANLPLRNTLTTYSRFGTAIDKYYDNITSMTKDVKRYVSGAWVTDLTNTLSFTYDYTQPPPNKHKPKSIKTEVKRGTAIGEARKVTMTYDAKGETASSTILFYDNTIYPVIDIRSTNRSLKIDNTYMLQFGNLAAQKITDLTDGKTRQVNYGYTTQAGMNGQFLVQQNLTDASGTLLSLQTFKANVLGWDGQPKEIEDNAGNLTELLYDQWDDLQSAALPNGRNLQVAKSIVTATDPDKPANAIAKSEIFTNTINPTLSDKTTYFDRMGRVLRTVTLYDDNPTVNVAEPAVKQLRYSDVSY